MKRLVLKGNHIWVITIGIITFSMTVLVELIFSVDAELIGFCKGLSIGIMIGGIIEGVIALIKKKTKK